MNKTCTKCGESKLLDLFPKHKRMRDGHASICSDCNKAKCREKYLANKERYKAAATEWKAANKERYREASRLSTAVRYQADPERHKAYAAAYREKHKDKLLEKWREDKRQCRAADPEKARKLSSQWAKANRPKVAVVEARRRAAELQRTTHWDTEWDDLVISEAFDLRTRRLEATGVQWHVDHIVPLQGKTVSGLHNGHNMAVIPASANLRKKNLYWPGMPC